MTQTEAREGGTAVPDPQPPRFGMSADGTSSPTGLMIKIFALAVVAAIAVWAALPLIGTGNWIGLIVLILVTALIFYIYLSSRMVPLKYLIPGTLFLVAFQIIPVIYTVSTAFTNFGDAHRGSQEQAIAAIEGASVTQVPGSPVYTLTIATDGDPAAGAITFLLADPEAEQTFVGTSQGLEELTAEVKQDGNGKITEASGYTVLSVAEISARNQDIIDFSVPTGRGTIENQGLSRAFEGKPLRDYNETCDCITDSSSGEVFTADSSVGSFVNDAGDSLAQGWKVNVGFENFTRALGDQTLRSSFLQIVIWNFAFAIGVVAITFVLGLIVAIVLNKEGLRGQRLYRSLIILPYAMPAVAMMLVWRDMFNTDFGLINRLLGTEINWFGNTGSSIFAVLLVQLWLGYNYMFLVITGALQAIPGDLTEAAQVDGAKPFHAFRTITFPLLLVALAPLMIASFAFNFNNFAGIYLVSQGGPFPPGNPTAGGTDILITYTYRLAFGGAGAQYGFAAAISVFIFLIVATISIASFRRTHALEEIN